MVKSVRAAFAAILAAAAAAGCGTGGSSSGNLSQFGYIGTVFDADQCNAFGIVAGNDFNFQLVTGAAQLTLQGQTCLAVFFGAGTLRDETGGFERDVTFDLAADLGIDDCADAGTLTPADIRGRAWTLIKTEDGTAQELDCVGAGAGGDISNPSNPVSFTATCEIDGTACAFTLQGGLFADFDVLGAIRLAPIV